VGVEGPVDLGRKGGRGRVGGRKEGGEREMYSSGGQTYEIV